MPNRVAIPPKRAGETVVLGQGGNSPFNFVGSLAPSETISAVTMLASVYSGVDPSPSLVVPGPNTVLGPQVFPTLAAGVLGCIYDIVCYVTTSLGQNLILEGYLAVIPGLP